MQVVGGFIILVWAEGWRSTLLLVPLSEPHPWPPPFSSTSAIKL